MESTPSEILTIYQTNPTPFLHSPQTIAQHSLATSHLRLSFLISRQKHYLPLISFLVTFLLFTTKLPFDIYCKDWLSMCPSELLLISAAKEIPWALKVFAGIISDVFPLFGSRKAIYIIIGVILYSLSWLSFSFISAHYLKTNFLLVILISTLQSAGLALIDVVNDSLIVETTKTKIKHKIQSKCFYFRSAGVLAGQFMAVLFMQDVEGKSGLLSPINLIRIGAIVSLVLIKISLQITESKLTTNNLNNLNNNLKKVNNKMNTKKTLSLLKTVVFTPRIFKLTLFIFTLSSSPSAGMAMFYFISTPIPLKGLGFSTKFISFLTLAGGFAHLSGNYIYNKYLSKYNLKKIYFLLLFTYLLIYISQLIIVFRLNKLINLPDGLFVFSEDVFADALNTMLSVPLQLIIARECPTGIEGSLYALIVSVGNTAGILSRVLSSAMMKGFGIVKNEDGVTNFGNLGYL